MDGEVWPVEWRTYEVRVDGRRLTLRFPSDLMRRQSPTFHHIPTPDRISGSVDIIGMTVAQSVGPIHVTNAYTLAVGVAVAETRQIGTAATAVTLMEALRDRMSELRRRGAVSIARESEWEILDVGKRQWVRRLLGRDKDPTVLESEDYFSLWDVGRLLQVHVRFGAKIQDDAAAVSYVRRLGREIVASIGVSN